MNSSATPPLYEGRAFWNSDPFGQPNCGVTGKKARVLIAGAGDGALQDFLRITTGFESAEELYRNCNIPLPIAQAIQSGEDRALRGWVWANPRSAYEHEVQQELQKVHLKAVRTALSLPDVRRSLDQLIPRQPTAVRLAYRCTHFNAYYGLNRFLGLLVAEYLRLQFGMRVLWKRTEIEDIVPTDGHTCMVQTARGWEPDGGYANPTCHGRNHRLTIRRAPSCFAPAATSPSRTITANVVIIRYGIRPGSSPTPPPLRNFPPRFRALQERYLLPYHLPS